MNEAQSAILAFLAGLLLGGVFFFGLWWTVRRSLASERPALWVSVSLLVRMTLAVAGLYLIGRGSVARLLLCLLGMLVARFIVIRTTHRSPLGHPPSDQAREREVRGAS